MPAQALVLCEKPSQARDVRTAIGNAYGTVLSAVGHLVMLEEPQDVNPAWAKWNDDLLMPPTGRYGLKAAPDAQKRKFIGEISKALRGCSLCIIATDPDREGQLIGQELLEFLGYRGQIKRVIYVAQDPKSIQDAFAQAQDNANFQSLYEAAVARQQGDQIFNLTLTRVATRNFTNPGEKGVVGIGRVRTPTLGLICRRELAIRNFKPQDYFEIVATAQGNAGQIVLRHAPEDPRILDQKIANAIAAAAQNYSGPIVISSAKKTQAPPLPLDLAAAQKAAGSYWQWTASKTLDELQKLYEAHLITYPRAESRHLPENMIVDVPALLAKIKAVPTYASLVPNPPVIRQGNKKQVFSDKALAGLSHHAIIPNVNSTIDFADVAAKQGPDGAKLFDLVARAYLCALSPDEEFEVFSAQINVPVPALDPEPKAFLAKTRQTIRPGWRIIMPVQGQSPFPPFKTGDIVAVIDTKLEAKATQPPNRYSDATLIKDMEEVWKFVDDPQERDLLKNSDQKGIGRPSTRNVIIDGLVQQKFVARSKNQLSATDRGLELYDMILNSAPVLIDPGSTARMEQQLDEIVTGGRDPDTVISTIAKNAEILIPAIVKAGQAQKLSQATGKAKPSQRNSKSSPKKPTGLGQQGLNHGQFAKTRAKGKNARSGGTATGHSGFKSRSPATASAAPGPTNPAYTYFNVPFAEKDDAKALGLRWDGNAKKWYAPDVTAAQRAQSKFQPA